MIGRRVSCPLFGSGESGKQGLYSRYEEGEDLMMVDVSPALGTDCYVIEEPSTNEEREIRDRV